MQPVHLPKQEVTMIKIDITALNSLHRAHFTGGGRIKPVAEYGCYYCGRIYSVAMHPVEEWVDGGFTALCPKCGIDAVIPRIYKAQFSELDMEMLAAEMFA